MSLKRWQWLLAYVAESRQIEWHLSQTTVDAVSHGWMLISLSMQMLNIVALLAHFRRSAVAVFPKFVHRSYSLTLIRPTDCDAGDSDLQIVAVMCYVLRLPRMRLEPLLELLL